MPLCLGLGPCGCLRIRLGRSYEHIDYISMLGCLAISNLSAIYLSMPPPTLYPIKKLIAITPETAQAIEDYRFENRLKTEAEAIRQLIAAGLGKTAAVPSGSGSGSARKPRSTAKSAGRAR